MRNLLALGAAGLLTFAVVGWYQGWYKVETTPAPDGHRQVTIDLNSPKITQDLNKSKAKLENMLESKGTAVPPAPGGTVSARLTPTPVPPAPEDWAHPTPGQDGSGDYQGQISVPPAPVLPESVAVPPPPGGSQPVRAPSSGNPF